jgi:hypothetical protein
MCREKNFSRRLEFGMFLMSQSQPDEHESLEFAEVMAKTDVEAFNADWLEHVLSVDGKPLE